VSLGVGILIVVAMLFSGMDSDVEFSVRLMIGLPSSRRIV
jgi:hypothetical protein